jgi:hypothetical protein
MQMSSGWWRRSPKDTPLAEEAPEAVLDAFGRLYGA